MEPTTNTRPSVEALPNPWADPIVVFCAARLDWCDHVRASTKANDVFFRGLAECLRHQQQGGSSVRFDVRIADWGVDREAPRTLIQDLGLNDHVDFVPFGDKTVFHQNVAEAHVVVDQFSLGAVGLTAIEAMALGRPVMAFVHDDLARRAYGASMPVMNCATPGDVRDCLLNLSAESLAAASVAAVDWVTAHHSDRHILGLLSDVYGGIVG